MTILTPNFENDKFKGENIMAEKNFNARIVHKHDTEENWNKAINFIPKQGELIIYDKDSIYDYERIKIGDGVTNVNVLPFATYQSIPELETDGTLTFTSEYAVNYDLPLPHITVADNGKFLRVVDGVWMPQSITNVSEVGA